MSGSKCRKIVVNETEYRYWVSKKFDRGNVQVSIRHNSKYISFVYHGDITPRMVKVYIEWNPNLEDRNGDIPDDLYNASIESFVHQSGLRVK